MNGVSDSYFQDKIKLDRILNVIFVWSSLHKQTGYRQGMHEIAATFYYVVDQELGAWNTASRDTKVIDFASTKLSQSKKEYSDFALNTVFNEKYLEAHTYWLFESVMNQLEILYSPIITTRGSDDVIKGSTIQDRYEDGTPYIDGEEPFITSYVNYVQSTAFYM